MTCIWHGHLGHISHNVLETLFHYGFYLSNSFLIFHFVIIVNMTNQPEMHDMDIDCVFK
mgnify:CR=1 FL=1